MLALLHCACERGRVGSDSALTRRARALAGGQSFGLGLLAEPGFTGFCFERLLFIGLGFLALKRFANRPNTSDKR
jgi:hypothetical protein